MAKYTIKEFNTQYPDDNACLADIFAKRYGLLKVCPDCDKKTKFHRVSKRKCYACQLCGYQLHPLAGTIFHKSDTSLKSWFYAIFLFANSKNGVSGKELERQLGVTYKTAWRMAKQIRLLFKQSKTPLKSPVEVDETYVGRRHIRGRTANRKRGRGAPGKTAVLGIVGRNGDIKTTVPINLRTETVIPFIQENVEPNATIYSDELTVYQRLKKIGFTHKTIRHLSLQFVKGNIHTNTIEGFWGQLKRSLSGTYHLVFLRALPTLKSVKKEQILGKLYLQSRYNHLKE